MVALHTYLHCKTLSFGLHQCHFGFNLSAHTYKLSSLVGLALTPSGGLCEMALRSDSSRSDAADACMSCLSASAFLLRRQQTWPVPLQEAVTEACVKESWSSHPSSMDSVESSIIHTCQGRKKNNSKKARQKNVCSKLVCCTSVT